MTSAKKLALEIVNHFVDQVREISEPGLRSTAVDNYDGCIVALNYVGLITQKERDLFDKEVNKILYDE